MNKNSLSGRISILAVLLIGCVLAVYAFATPALSQQAIGNQQQGNGSFSYAQLRIVNNQVTWDVGGGDVPRQESILVAYRRLGGTSQRVTFVNLLNAIGAEGWELVEIENDNWTFKR